jgi:hypothetical protein
MEIASVLQQLAENIATKKDFRDPGVRDDQGMHSGAQARDGSSAGVDVPPRAFVYLFEAKSLQRYIFESGRLHDMVAASALIDALTRGERSVLDRVVDSLPAADRPEFSRRAGGSLAAHFTTRESLEHFRDAWTLALRMSAPGLEFVQAAGSGENAATAASAARAALAAAHNSTAPLLPVAGPYSERAPRTGSAATEQSRKDGDLVDFVTAGKRRAAERLFVAAAESGGYKQDPVAFRLSESLGTVRALWPLNLDRAEGASTRDEDPPVVFPYLSGPPYIGVIHADGNGLGQLVMELGRSVQSSSDADYVAVMRAFSDGLDAATHAAVSTATMSVLVPKIRDRENVLPARPFILGGDDLGMIVRGDCALDFTKSFLEAFEDETGRFIESLRARFPGALAEGPLPERLTAAAGIAYVKPHQPFFRAYELAESLCQHAKSQSRKRAGDDAVVPSAVTFHRITTSMIDDYESVRERELLRETGGVYCELSMQPWYVGCRADAGARLASLIELLEVAKDANLSVTRLREVIESVGAGRLAEAERQYRRWRSVVGSRSSKSLESFDGALRTIIGTTVEQTFLSGPERERDAGHARPVRATPLADLLTLRALAREDAP